ncbi:hypothetical protein [Halohasta salina]|uniref:hypothetical protein n=1 Tax=Halohasta salina TaxID=2961621 RepID=UPI0020A391A5|nr:hypothetical protein [Halohasta salina]
MQPEDAVKQVQCVANASLAETGQRVAPLYEPTFQRVADEGTGTDVTQLADRLCTAISSGDRPNVDEAEGMATDLLSQQRALTDGGRQ